MTILVGPELSGCTWVSASKTKPMQVKHVSALLSDLGVAASLLVRTLEGDERIQANAFICVGPTGEMWQQSSKTLFSKYDVIDCNDEGWWTARPKEGNLVDACHISDSMSDDGEFSIRALWGTAADDGTFYQTGKVGDWILRSRDNPEDVWIVRGSIFASTYETR